MSIGSFGDAIRITNELYENGKTNNIPLAMVDALQITVFF